jgi:hypothetical protein
MVRTAGVWHPLTVVLEGNWQWEVPGASHGVIQKKGRRSLRVQSAPVSVVGIVVAEREGGHVYAASSPSFALRGLLALLRPNCSSSAITTLSSRKMPRVALSSATNRL